MTLAIYSLSLLAIGFYFRRSSSDAAGFFLASRALGPAQVGFSLAATGLGGSAILIASLLVYTRGLTGPIRRAIPPGRLRPLRMPVWPGLPRAPMERRRRSGPTSLWRPRHREVRRR